MQLLLGADEATYVSNERDFEEEAATCLHKVHLIMLQ